MTDLYMGKGESMPRLKRITFRDENQYFTELVVHLGWDVRDSAGPAFDLDVCVFPLTEAGTVPTGRYCVYYNNLSCPDGAIVHEGDDYDGSGGGEIVRVHLRRVAAVVQRIVFAVVIYNAVERHEHFGNIAHAFIRFTPEGGTAIDEHRIAGNFAKFTGVVIGELFRADDHWEFRSVDKGYYGGLSEIGHIYGVNFVDEAPARSSNARPPGDAVT